MKNNSHARCPTCFEQFNNTNHIPLCLNCGHSFCSTCLNAVQQSSSSPESRCPICRTKFSNITPISKNYSILEIAECSTPPLRKRSGALSISPFPEYSAKSAKKKCLIHPHKKITNKPLKNFIFSISKKYFVIVRAKQNTKKQHKYFCLTCEEPICSKCVTTMHCRHAIERPMNTREEIRNSLNKFLILCQEQQFDTKFLIQSCNVAHQHIIQTRKDELRRISKILDKLVHLIMERRDALLGQIHLIYDQLEKQAKDQIESAKKLSTQCEETFKKLTQLLEKAQSSVHNLSIKELNKEASITILTLERELIIKQEKIKDLLKTNITTPECSFNTLEMMEFVERLGKIGNCPCIPQIYDSELNMSEREPKVLFFKNSGESIFVCPFNIHKGVWESNTIIKGSRAILKDMAQTTPLLFGEIGFTGGFSKETNSESQAFYILSQQMKIEVMPSLKAGRCFHATVEILGELYVFGGLNAKQRTNTCEKICYFSETAQPRSQSKWVSISRLNISRSQLSACVFDYKTIYVFGGEQFASFEKYSVPLDTWELLEPLREMTPYFILNAVGLFKSPDTNHLIIFGRFYAISYDVTTREVVRQMQNDEYFFDKPMQNKSNIIVFNKRHPQVCHTFQIYPFKAISTTSCSNSLCDFTVDSYSTALVSLY